MWTNTDVLFQQCCFDSLLFSEASREISYLRYVLAVQLNLCFIKKRYSNVTTENGNDSEGHCLITWNQGA